MNLYVRTLSCLALLGMSLATLSQYRPTWAAGMSLDWWSLPELREEIRLAEEKDAALDRAGAGAGARVAAKEEISRDLLAGRLTLLQAAARFRAVNASAVDANPMLRDRFPGATEEERVCRQVIDWADAAAEFGGSPGSGRPTRERLEAELNALLAKNHGRITLPE